MSRIEISFVTGLYNCLGYTKNFLKSLEETVQDVNYEAILIDDGSSDGTREFLSTLSDPPYTVLFNDRNRGFAWSNNRGASRARGTYLCLLNNDIILKPGWLKPMLRLIREEPNVGAVGNIQIHPETRLVEHAGVFFDLKGKPRHAWRYRKKPPTGEYKDWNAATAACLLLPTDLFRELDGFDEGYHNSFEDIDLCVRLRKRGYRILVSHQSVIEHYVSMSPGRTAHDPENTQLFLDKWQAITREWGRKEWPRQYFHRYARQCWKMNPRWIGLAMWLLLSQRFRPTT